MSKTLSLSRTLSVQNLLPRLASSSQREDTEALGAICAAPMNGFCCGMPGCSSCQGASEIEKTAGDRAPQGLPPIRGGLDRLRSDIRARNQHVNHFLPR